MSDGTTAPRVWDPSTYDASRRKMVADFDGFYGAAAGAVADALVGRDAPRILDLGAGTGILSGFVAERLPGASFVLLDGWTEMLAVSRQRLPGTAVTTKVADLTDPLPPGPFDAVVSALAVHHLTDDRKADLYAGAAGLLTPGGMLVNADQVAGPSAAATAAYREAHRRDAAAQGATDAEWAGAVERMGVDLYSTVPEQLGWMSAAGLIDADCVYKRHGFAVMVGRAADRP